MAITGTPAKIDRKISFGERKKGRAVKFLNKHSSKKAYRRQGR